MKSGQWMYNFGDEENWNEGEYFNTKEEAIEAGKEEAISRDEESYQVGQIACFIPHIDADIIFEIIGEDAYEECGEHADNYPSVSKEEAKLLEERLNKVLSKWLDETNNNPTFYKIINERNYTVDV